MVPRLSHFLLIVSLAFILWSGVVMLSEYVASYDAPVHGREISAQAAGITRAPSRAGVALRPSEQLSNVSSIAVLEEQVKASPQDTALRLSLASALHEQARSVRSGEMFMRAVEEYSVVLSSEPDNPRALLGLAYVCLDSGLFEAAAEYFRRYLVMHPEDEKARVDQALAFIQAGKTEEAERSLRLVIGADPGHFAARLALALSLRVAGKVDDAQREAEKAREFAPDSEGREAVDRFLATFSKSLRPGALAGSSPSLLSPAATIEDYFRSHEILGPKISAVTWPTPLTCEVTLREFPIESMPPVAKERFVTKTQQFLSHLPERITISLIAAENGRRLLEIVVGQEGA